MVISRNATKNRLSRPEAKSILRHIPRRGLFHHLYEGPEALLKTDSITYSFVSFISKSMKKKGADLKNNKASYKDTRITLNEAVVVRFCRYCEHVLVCWVILRNNELAENLKEICIKQSSSQ